MQVKKLIVGGAAIAALGSIVAACGGDDSVKISSGTVLLNATVVSTEDGSLTAGQSIVIDGGKIQNITGKSIDAGSGVQTVDASGKFIVPGFLDMHTHAMQAADLPVTYWPLLIANGITGIRDMGGNAATVQRVRQLNADSAAGKVDAPEVVSITSDIFVGQAPTAAAATQFVDQKLAEGADFIKVVGGSRDAVMAILAEAKLKNSHVAGHLVPTISALDSSNAGWRAFEHLGSGWGLLLDCASEQTAIRQAILSAPPPNPPYPATYVINPRAYDGANYAPFYQRIQDTYSDSQCQSLAKTLAANGTWQVPTLIRLRTQSFGNDPAYLNDPNLVYVDKTRRALWKQIAAQYATLPASASATLQRYYGLQQKATKLLADSGVPMMTGSDLSGIWVVPGFSLHQEFRELSASGLSPLTVLQMATLNGAKFLKREATMGTVATGKNADLVLLDANPLADTANLSKISGVVVKGKYFAKTALDKMKSDVAAAYNAQPLQSVQSVLDPHHVD
ncbi:MAG: amidohydrolase family protein [Pseudomonadota bacterium]